MKAKTKQWEKTHMTKGIKIVQSRITANHGGGFITQVTLSDENGQEVSGWNTVDGTDADTLEQAQHEQAFAFHDVAIPEPITDTSPIINPTLNSDGSIDRETTFIEAQKVQQAQHNHDVQDQQEQAIQSEQNIGDAGDE